MRPVRAPPMSAAEAARRAMPRRRATSSAGVAWRWAAWLTLLAALCWLRAVPALAVEEKPAQEELAQEEIRVIVEGGTEVVRPPPAKPLPSQAGQAGTRVVLTREQFQESEKTVADVLADQPGVSVTRSGDALSPAKVTLRGSRADQVLVIVDGVPQDTETDNPAQGRLTGRQGVDLSQLELADVESIEIVRGAASGLYGPGAAAGAIVIRTRRPRQRELTVERGVGSGGYQDTGVSGAEPLGGSTLTYAARNRVSDGRTVYFDPNAAQGIGGPPNPCAENLGGGYFLRQCNRTEISTAGVALLQGDQRRIALDWQDYDRHGLGGIQDPRPFGRERRTRTGLTYADGTRGDAGRRLDWQLTAVAVDGHRTENEQVTSGVLENHHVEEARAAEAWWMPLAISSAAEAPSGAPGAAAATVQGAAVPGAAVPGAIGPQVRLGAGAGSLSLRDEFFSAQRDQGWLAGQWSRRGEAGTLEANVRGDAYSDVPGQVTWRLAATEGLLSGASGAFGVKASAGTGYRPPTLYELYDPGSTLGTSAANPALKAEASQSADAGFYLERPDGFYGELIAFQQEYLNSIVLLANPASPALFRFENLTRTRSTGSEALVAWKPSRGLTLSATVTRTRAVLLDNDAIDPRDNGNQVPGVPEERGAAELSWRREGWSLYVKVRAAGKRFVDTANSRALNPYAVWDGGMTVPLSAGFELALDGRNLGNEVYAETDNFPAPGLQVFLTLRWRLHPPAAGPSAPSAPPPPMPLQAPRAMDAPQPPEAFPTSPAVPSPEPPAASPAGTSAEPMQPPEPQAAEPASDRSPAAPPTLAPPPEEPVAP